MINIYIEEKDYQDSEIKKTLGESAYFELVRCNIIFEKENLSKFKYVGILFHEDKFTFVLPKFFRKKAEKDISISDIDFIRDVLIKYTASQPFISSSKYEEDGIICNPKILASINIIDFYLDNGLYFPITEERIKSFDHPILWNSTVENTLPIISEGTPVYLEPIAKKNSEEENSIITEVQKLVTVLAGKLVAQILYSDLNIELNSSCSIENSDYYISILENHLQNVYSDQEVLLLNNVLTFLRERNETTTDEIEVFGTKTFHVVWEKANKVLWQDNYSKLKEYVPKPIWVKNDVQYLSKHSLIPDILYENENQFLVVDAKYYLPKFNNSKVSGQPQVESITKQIMYKELIQESFPDHEFINVFCFPDDSKIDDFNLIQDLKIELFDGKVNFSKTKFEDILTIYLPPLAVLNNYLQDKSAELNIGNEYS